MNSKTKYVIFKYGVYCLLAVFLCVMQNTPGLFVVCGVKPMPVAALSVIVAMMDGELAGGLFGAYAGFLCDLYGADKVGYTALMLFVCCVAVGLAVQTFMRPVALNCALFTFLSMLVIRGISFFFVIYIRGVEDAGLFFLTSVLPLCLYTAATGLLLYPLMTRIRMVFEEKIQT